MLIVISAVALVVSFFAPDVFPFNPGWVAIVLCGLPIVVRAIVALITEFDIKADVLVSLALIASIIVDEIFAAGEVALIMQLGGLLEELTVARARAGIERLVELSPLQARVLEDGTEVLVPAEAVQVGAILRVLPGEQIPVDGVVVAGATSVNQAVMTGESLPVDKVVGDEVLSGTVNQYGTFDMRTTRTCEDSSIQRMIALVQSADAGKARIVNIADRWATWIVVGALVAAAIAWLVTGEVLRAVTVLVVFCPCALVLATPTAIMAGIGNATKHGFLVREGDALERLSLCQQFAFDKTGTLTYGRPEVVAVVPVGAGCGNQEEQSNQACTPEKLLQLVASAELRSEHPLGQAIVRAASEARSASSAPTQPQDFTMQPGRGVRAVVEGTEVLAGNAEMLVEAGVAIPEEANMQAGQQHALGRTVVYVAADGEYAGFVSLADRVRSDARAALDGLRNAGAQPVLITGDSAAAAQAIAGEVGITEVRAMCLPADKLAYIEQAENAEEHVCMVGDGVNDAPALKRAMVGIALGGVGSDIAVDAADIALVDDAIAELPHLFALAKHMMNVIRANLTFSMLLNFVAIVLAITAVLNPVTGALVHNCGSVFVIVNSALLLRWRRSGE